MRHHMLRLLNLQGFWVDGYTITENQLVVAIRSPRRSAVCPRCQHVSRRIHQIHQRYLKHTRWGPRQVMLKLIRRRFWCRWCGRAFGELLSGIGRRRSTPAYREGLVEELRRQSFRYVMKKTGASSNLLYDALHGATRRPIDWTAQGTAITIGVDEHSYRGRHLVTTVTNITTPRLLGVGRSDSQGELRRLLVDIPAKTVAEVCMDMRAGYRPVIQECLPQARIVIDKFHVIAAANRVVDQIRSVIVTDHRHVKRLLLTGQERLHSRQTEKLQQLFRDYAMFPTLKQSYLVKEKVRAMYESTDRATAARCLDHMIMLCETGDTQYLQVFGRTLNSWREEILNHFIRHSTNAVTEGINTKIKMIKRVSFGFRNIDHYIAKVMLAFTPLTIAIATLNHHTI